MKSLPEARFRRSYLVESVGPSAGRCTLVSLACLDDDAQGQPLEVVWEYDDTKRYLVEMLRAAIAGSDSEMEKSLVRMSL